jgi:hypothetical protein
MLSGFCYYFVQCCEEQKQRENSVDFQLSLKISTKIDWNFRKILLFEFLSDAKRIL